MNQVRAMIAMIRADRPRWTVSEELIRLWEADLGHIPTDILEGAALHFLRTQKGYPNLASIREAITACRGERDAQEAQDLKLLPAFQDITSDQDCTPAQLLLIHAKHPWYDPDATMLDNLELSMAHSDALGAPPVFDASFATRKA
ncbi:unnamed protein product [marine sediment metagenome]|uniref:Uncharacterized protein n=1 Tax=marine sediment metagenome TaxID=412755 RepID=X0SUS3_9ZZZZ